METLIQLALADEYKIFRDGIKAAMKSRDFIKIVWEAGDRMDMIKKLKILTPDVLLLEITMLGTTAIEDVRLIKKEYEDVKVVIFSIYDDNEIIRNIMEHGGNAYLSKRADGDEIYKAIVTCIKEGFYFNDLVNAAVLNKLQEKKTIKNFYPKPVKFNDKELKILKLISEDKTTNEISKNIFLSPRTVETIRQNMKTKVGAKTIAGLLMYAVTNKLLE